MTKQKITNNMLLDMLGVILVEIRANENPSYAQIMSDVFHNVPARLIRGIPAQQIYEDMEVVAKRHNVEKYLIKLLKHSSKKNFDNGVSETSDCQ